ncbi:MAG: ABC transporter permease [Bacteroidetes bacterium]|nr:ABC transporter permease [Bacteroidota bacterium]
MLFLTIFKESVLFAIHALVVNKLRTFLSLLGITIGIFAIISVFTVVDSLETGLRKSVSSLGDNVVFVQKWPWTFGPNYPWWKYINRPLPRVNELGFIQRKSKCTDAATLTISGRRTVKYQSSSVANAEIVAVSHDYDRVKFLDLEQGRYFTDIESAGGRNIAVVGAAIAEGLFPGGNAMGKEVKIAGRNVMIIGIIKKQGEGINIFGTTDNQVILPINFVRSIIDINSDNIDPSIMVKAKAGVSNDQLIDELRGIMRAVRKLKPKADDDFALNQSSLISKQFDSLFDIVGVVGWIIGGFSILVGGFGIANIMFVSVKERTPIIGIQKALGAKRYFILMQFLTEAVVLSVIGGIVGLVVVYAGTLIVGYMDIMDISLSFGNIMMGLIISGVIGVISGFVPSYTASRLDPVEAIRSN